MSGTPPRPFPSSGTVTVTSYCAACTLASRELFLSQRLIPSLPSRLPPRCLLPPQTHAPLHSRSILASGGLSRTLAHASSLALPFLTFPSPGQHSPAPSSFAAHSLLDSCLSLLAPGRPSPAASGTVPPLTFYTFCSLHRLLGCTSVSFPDTFGFCPCEGTAPATSSRFSLSVERRPYAHPLLVCHALSSPRSGLCPLHTLPTPPTLPRPS